MRLTRLAYDLIAEQLIKTTHLVKGAKERWSYTQAAQE